ncbi:hypothetical protein [Yinghuangia seranimata]|uniref:hypothetical protein n=1 Tax=Yinghuangia seranimata TaxID=408067 RepID=UPI00248B9CDE|nr:hypothetical protein [Yinghuangia seranimata]MDI2127878.1 hypothetical protein [Yinghuangia seranimata]
MRAVLFAAVCVVLALGGHTMVSGMPVAAWAPFCAFVVLVVVGWFGASRERGLVAIGGTLVAAQAVLHVVFALAHRPAAAGVTITPSRAEVEAQWLRVLLCNEGSPPGPGVHRGDAAELLADMGLNPVLAERPPVLGASHVMPDGQVMAGHAGHAMPEGMAGHSLPWEGGSAGLLMLAAHLVAACLTALWLRRGEKAVHRVVALLASAALGVFAAALALVLAWVRRAAEVPWPRLGVVVRRVPLPAARWVGGPVTRRGPPSGLAAA